MSQMIDLTGRRFGRLVVIERQGTQKDAWHYDPLWLCRCDCGTECLITGPALRYGKTRSCGCLRKELSRARLEEHNKRKRAMK